MDINLNNIGKRYRFEWIFKGITHQFITGSQSAILGPNGCGKSTFLSILSGHLTPSKGKIDFLSGTKAVDKDEVYKEVSIAAPYMELIEEMTLLESLDFHQKFKPFLDGLTSDALIDLLNFSNSRNKEIKYFSSGMKQRLKLVLAICSTGSLLLLDEPTTNLDKQGVSWYLDLINRYTAGRTLIVASNIEHDYDFCENRVNILDFKPVRK